MKKIFKRGIMFSFISCFSLASSVLASATTNQGEVPNCMQPNSVIIYDEDLNYRFESGGEASDDEQQGSDVYACPGMKAVYDKDGILRNAYYPSGKPGEYQLNDTVSVVNKSGVKSKGSGKYTYRKCYLNFGKTKVNDR